MNITIVKRLPGIEEYNQLRRAADWPVYPNDVVQTALSNSLFGVVAQLDNGDIVAMGRVIGDGAIYFHVQDIIVQPEFQGSGVGRMIMHEILGFIDARSVKNTNVGLMCSKGREEFYRKFGFMDRPAEKFGAGMIMIK